MEFSNAVLNRHSEYMLDDRLDEAGTSVAEIVERLRLIAPAVPSSYNSQSARTFVLTGDAHKKFWEITEDMLRKKVSDDVKFKRTETKLRNFAKAAGTVLFYEVDGITDKLIEENPSYADKFPIWAEHGNAMLQFAFWTAMYDLGLGANIQHYNPIVDERVRKEFAIPDGYRLVAQLVFGRICGESERKNKISGDVIVGELR